MPEITELDLKPEVKADTERDAEIRADNVDLAKSYIERLKLTMSQLEETAIPEKLLLDLGSALSHVEDAVLKRKVEIEGHI